MKKLSTILSTIFFICISSISAYATCSDLYSHGTLTVGYFDVHYYTQSGAGQIVQTVSPPSTYYVYPADTIYLNQLNIYFNTALSPAKLYQFSGSFNFTSTQPNDFNLNYPTSLPAPTIIDSSGHEIGYCDIPTLSINTSSTSRYYNGNDFYAYKNIPYSVQCHSNGTGSPLGISFKLDFGSLYGAINQYPFSVSPYVSQPYTYSNNEYDYNFCTLQEAIQNISFSDSGITGAINSGTQNIINNNNTNTQDIIDNNNNNTQQIVEQLTNEICTQEQCSNVIDLSSATNTSSRGLTWTYNNNKISLTGTTTSSGNYALGGSAWNPNNYYFSGDYKFSVSQSLPFDLVIVQDLNCKLFAGQTSVICHSSSGQHYYNPKFNNIPSNTTFNIQDLEMYLSANLEQEFCSYGSVIEHCSGSNRLDNINNSISDVNNTLNDSSTDGVSSEFQDIIDDFNFNDHGLTSFLLIPVNAAQNLLTATCTPVHLQFPYLNNKSIDLPCYSPIFDNNFLTLMTLIRICTNGIIAYYCVMQIYKMMINLSNPDHANIEVFEL